MASGCYVDRKRDSFRLLSLLSSAVSEWLLMFLLFLNALFSFLVTKFARYCKLQTPCLLCSRLDYTFGDGKPGFCSDLICDSHKSEISSLAYCHVHQRLANVNEMCEGCLLSFATEKKSNTETYRSLVGKLGSDFDSHHSQDNLNGEDATNVPLLTEDPASGSSITSHCSCCSRLFRKKSNPLLLLQKNPIEVDDAEFDMSKPNSIGRSHLHLQPRSSANLENSLGSPSTNHLGNHGFDRLSRVGYSEVKITSDSDSEKPFSDDDGDGVAEVINEDFADRCLKPEPATTIPDNLPMPRSDDSAMDMLIDQNSSKHESSLSIPEDQLIHVGGSEDISSASPVAVAVAAGHGLEEINWNKVEAKTAPTPSQTISKRDSFEFPDAKLSSVEDHYASVSATSIDEHSKPLMSTDTNLLTSQLTSNLGPTGPVHLDLNDAYKLAIGSKSSLPSPTVAEVITGRDSSKVYEDLRILISHFSAARGLESPWNEFSPSPRLQGQGDDFKYSDASSSAILQNITKSLSIERNESGLESLDGSIVSEIEGESAFDRLKRQVELDRKSMYLLYKELEEERSASAIAANQAMAMITRLQEEKAAMQMEALQYQRMMEEQSEYDQEALQKLNELLAQREKEIQDLDADVQSYKKRFGDKVEVDNVVKPSSNPQVAKYDTSSMAGEETSRGANKLEKNGSDASDLMLGFEDEKAYISDCLKKLEEKLLLFSNNGMHTNIAGVVMEEDGHLGKSCKDENGDYIKQNDVNSAEETESNGPNGLEHPHGNLEACLNEVSQLKERLKMLEADRDFVEHTINTLKNGNDGIRFIEEIACQLQDLRRIGITLREHNVA